MRDSTGPTLTKWPFFVGDALLLCAAYLIYSQTHGPLGLRELSLIALCIAAAASLGILPFILEYGGLVKVAEATALTTVVAQIQKLETIAGEITTATGRWQFVQEAADKTATSAKEISDRMTSEAQAFAEFLQKANDNEKGTLRLEVEKLRRAENEWLQVLVRMLDHVYAVHVGAVRSGEPNLIEQMRNFQNACREAARRVGLAPFAAEPSEAFDAQRHQVLGGNGAPPAGSLVAETIATGYTFQSRMLRPALVRLQNGKAEAAPESALAVTGNQ
jgi:molecular chaperone GrpE (heat shock protein)